MSRLIITMPHMRFILLLMVLTTTSCTGYKFRCWWGCTDQTAIQNDYIAERNRCRDYAQLKLDLSARNTGDPDNDQSRKARLVNLFNECMANNGWGIVEGKQDKPAAAKPAAAGAAAATPPATNAATAAADDKSALSRSAECAFARQSTSVSSLAAARAKACDLECAQRLRLAPEAPRPAACPAEMAPNLATGVDRIDP